MNFDYHDKYKDLSTLELLKIVRRPNEYQAAAVDEATRILSAREVTPADLEQADRYFHEIDNETQRKTEKINLFKEKAADLFEPALNPTAEVKPQKWLNLLLLVIGLQYLWALYINITAFVRFIKRVFDCETNGYDNTSEKASYWTCLSNQFDPFVFFQVLTLVYVPIIFYLLFKRKRWGWILLFADNLFGLISAVSQSYIFFKYYYHGDSMSFFIPILIKALLVFFLWRNSISDFFSVTKETKKKTAIVTTTITILFILSVKMFV
jgi:hypothetical protein